MLDAPHDMICSSTPVAGAIMWTISCTCIGAAPSSGDMTTVYGSRCCRPHREASAACIYGAHGHASMLQTTV